VRDPRIDDYARLLVGRSIDVQPGWQVQVRATPLARPLVEAVLEEIAARFHTELKGVPSIGDSLKDLQAAESVGAQPILVLTGKGEKTLRAGDFPRHTVIYPDLAFAAAALLADD